MILQHHHGFCRINTKILGVTRIDNDVARRRGQRIEGEPHFLLRTTRIKQHTKRTFWILTKPVIVAFSASPSR